jgi:hypothetical protein
MEPKSKVLILRPDAELRSENVGNDVGVPTQERLSVVSQGRVLAWDWGISGVASYEEPIWEAALANLLKNEESV